MDGIHFYYFTYGTNLAFLRMLERTDVPAFLGPGIT
jgi:hypothetical protein